MPTLNINGNILVNTVANWTADTTVYSAKKILISSDALYGATDQPKYKIANGTDTWANLDYFPVSGYDDATSSIQTQLNSKQASLGFTAENVANKSTSVVTDQASDTKYPSVKSVYDWVVANFFTNPMTTLGDIIYGGASGTGTRLAGNTGLWRKKLSQTGDGTNSATPIWVNDMVSVVMSGDQSTTSDTATNVTDLVFSVEANSRYMITGFLRIGCNNTGGVKFAVDVPASATFSTFFFGRSTGNTVFLNTAVSVDATLTLTAHNRINNAFGSVLVSGEITTGASAGTVQFMFASGVNTETSTIYQESTILNIQKI